METDRLIASLAGEAAATRPLRAPAVRAAGWTAITVPLVAAGVWLLGPRPDLTAAFPAAAFLTVLALAVATSLSCGGAALALAVPGRLEAGLGRWLPAGLLLAWGGWLVWMIAGEGLSVPGTLALPATACIAKVAALGLLPAGAAFVLVRRGAPIHRLPAAGLAAAAGLALASAAVPFACPIDAAGHQFFMHFLPVPVLAAGAAVVGRAWLTWPRR